MVARLTEFRNQKLGVTVVILRKTQVRQFSPLAWSSYCTVQAARRKPDRQRKNLANCRSMQQYGLGSPGMRTILMANLIESWKDL
jgi:hypothetical protein